MPRLGVQRDTLAKMLRSHGEDDLAERVASITDDELTSHREARRLLRLF